jgi:hypothetical protein
MKIVFLCGSLEPGRDGVGDYVRRMALELLRQGHQPAAVALNDKYVSHETSLYQQEGSYNLPILRLPSLYKINKRFERAHEWIDEIGAEWISLQFVPFSFHPKGLSFDLAARLVRLGKGRSWHLMIHELWVGMDIESPIKHKLWGAIQRHLIKSLVRQLTPKIIHTQTLLYQAQLSKLGFFSYYLPLFSNIPTPDAALTPIADYHLASVPPNNKSISLVIFGTIHAGAPAKEFAQDVARYAKQNAASVTLIIIGRCGSEQEFWTESWKAVGLTVEILGEQSPEKISEVLMKATIGISTTPPLLIEKSGTTAAMLEHGLAVLCVTRSWIPRGINMLINIHGVMIYRTGEFGSYLNCNRITPRENSVSKIAYQLIADLKNKS